MHGTSARARTHTHTHTCTHTNTHEHTHLQTQEEDMQKIDIAEFNIMTRYLLGPESRAFLSAYTQDVLKNHTDIPPPSFSGRV